MPHVFTIPGLGFTPDLFSRLHVPHPTKHLTWIEPTPDEPLADYAHRIAQPIRDTPQPITLIGHSFGGVVAQEIAAQQPVDHVILISSVKSRREMPLWLRSTASLGAHRLFSKRLTLGTFPLWARFLGYPQQEERELFRRMVATQTGTTLRWSLQRLSQWQGTDCGDTRIHHIHGDRDHTLPFRRIRQPVTHVKGGSHIMVFSLADQVGELVRNAIDAT